MGFINLIEVLKMPIAVKLPPLPRKQNNRKVLEVERQKKTENFEWKQMANYRRSEL